MKKYILPEKDTWNSILARPTADYAALEKPVRKILQKVKEKGDKATRKYTKSFDGVSIKKMRVSEKEISDAASLISTELKDAINQAKANIYAFHVAQEVKTEMIETMPGVKCWRKPVPIERIGLYIPGGTAPLFSTVLMLGIPAMIAGCKNVMLCTPPGKDGNIHPAILYAAACCGITDVFKVGGAQAIGAMAYGTETIDRVYKIFGPGNSYVTMAKQLVQQDGVAIDLPAGPSELLVIADDSAVPAFVAADLLSQAEHGPDSQVILVTTSDTIAISTLEEIKRQVKELPRKEIAKKALNNSRLILVKDLETAVEISNQYAPEHLVLACNNAVELAAGVTAAGSVFIGNYSPESAGDYASGTNHTLPTNGYAAMYSGVSIDSFVKKITYQQLTHEGLRALGDTVMHMAAAEQLEGHKNAIAIRLKQL